MNRLSQNYSNYTFGLKHRNIYYLLKYLLQKYRLSQNELNSTIGINSTKTAAQNGYELFLGVNNK
jgi:hypothetical protein